MRKVVLTEMTVFIAVEDAEEVPSSSFPFHANKMIEKHIY